MVGGEVCGRVTECTGASQTGLCHCVGAESCFVSCYAAKPGLISTAVEGRGQQRVGW